MEATLFLINIWKTECNTKSYKDETLSDQNKNIQAAKQLSGYCIESLNRIRTEEQ